MKMAPGSPLEISLHWNADDVQIVGRLAYRDKIAYLEYDQGFLTSGLELSPVHQNTAAGLHRPHDPRVFEGLHGLFADSLPDGWGRLLIDRRARQLDIEPATLTPLDRLACVGNLGIGALSYAPAIDAWDAREPTLNLDLNKLARSAQLVLEGDVGEVVSELGQVGGSPGGARPKALIAIDAQGNAIHGAEAIPQGYVPYLVKFAGRDDPEDVACIEQAYAMMAAAAGVKIPDTRRFDRDGAKRLHVHSASGLLYADIRLPSLDYNDLIALTRHLTRDQRDCQAMFTLAVFNVLAHNRDDHARQFSFIMARDGTWRFAPAYDLTFAYGPGGEHSTTVLGLGKDISRDQLIALGKKADLRDMQAARIIERAALAVGDWKRFAMAYDVGAASRKRIAKALASIRI